MGRSIAARLTAIERRTTAAATGVPWDPMAALLWALDIAAAWPDGRPAEYRLPELARRFGVSVEAAREWANEAADWWPGYSARWLTEGPDAIEADAVAVGWTPEQAQRMTDHLRAKWVVGGRHPTEGRMLTRADFAHHPPTPWEVRT